MADSTASSLSAAGTSQRHWLLEVRDLAKSFGGLRAVDHCSFQVERGTITGLIGPNGAGKTTVFNLITGFIPPDSGRILLDGQDIGHLRPDQIFARGLCRTFQIPREHGSMSVLENLLLVPAGQSGERWWNAVFRPGRVQAEESRNLEKAREVLDYLQLTHVRDEYAANLSGGQKKLLEMGRMLMADPRIILLDEPAAGVNRTLLQSIIKNIQTLSRERGITFLLIEHDMNMVMNLCNPVIVMSEGRKLAEGDPESVRGNQDVLAAYLGGQYAAAEG
ncbi:ABC transporter ATP-binding protein [Castellaniella sp. MT123]|uniref:ABC transporter ATP-binding protein n=1 Tax=Castellaniella sp. MT123 TaxID=3140381 RepID=UPI0031F4780E|nr:ABC transporter ATP-binding protein [Castellaniella sp.]